MNWNLYLGWVIRTGEAFETYSYQVYGVKLQNKDKNRQNQKKSTKFCERTVYQAKKQKLFNKTK